MVSAPNRRLVIAVLAVLAVLTLAGCSAMSNDISDDQLDRDADYDELRERNATVAIDLEAGGLFGSGEFAAVYAIEGTDELEVYRQELYQDRPLDVHSVRFWYPNGTVVTGSNLDVEGGGSRTTIGLPAENGTLAFSGPAGKKSVTLPNYRSGSYNVTLPRAHRSSSLLLGSVSPNGYDRTVRGDTESLYWGSLEDPVSIRYYHERDRLLFYGIVALVVIVGGAVAAVTYRRLRRLQRQRADHGLEIDD